MSEFFKAIEDHILASVLIGIFVIACLEIIFQRTKKSK